MPAVQTGWPFSYGTLGAAFKYSPGWDLFYNTGGGPLTPPFPVLFDLPSAKGSAGSSLELKTPGQFAPGFAALGNADGSAPNFNSPIPADVWRNSRAQATSFQADRVFNEPWITDFGFIWNNGDPYGDQFCFRVEGEKPRENPVCVTPAWDLGAGWFYRLVLAPDGELIPWRAEGPQGQINYLNAGLFDSILFGPFRLQNPGQPRHALSTASGTDYFDEGGVLYRTDHADGSSTVYALKWNPLAGESWVSKDDASGGWGFAPTYWKALWLSDSQIRALTPPVAIAVYYTLLKWQLPKGGGCPQFVPNPVVSPNTLPADGFLRETGLRQRIYNLRTDLWYLPDGKGGKVPGLIEPNGLPYAGGMKCVQTLLVNVVTSLAESVLSAIPILGTAVSLGKFVANLTSTLGGLDYANKLKALSASELTAYNAAVAAANAGWSSQLLSPADVAAVPVAPAGSPSAVQPPAVVSAVAAPGNAVAAPQPPASVSPFQGGTVGVVKLTDGAPPPPKGALLTPAASGLTLAAAVVLAFLNDLN